ncbi:hypothetical protein CABS01_01092 [Colletotrichum abscissum]|uniref:uncharacterized protein n=1 Tax=Colletotrichum abscissum TaxID=1671311 RepID=UPI0027D4C8FF|nr:uncharacterized protein CABS01_01092 [Colletotrichum abscissum]KAK1505624.1 hypothetical protein CABS01_01092 [Colletotrichum abscissum]
MVRGSERQEIQDLAERANDTDLSGDQRNISSQLFSVCLCLCVPSAALPLSPSVAGQQPLLDPDSTPIADNLTQQQAVRSSSTALHQARVSEEGEGERYGLRPTGFTLMLNFFLALFLTFLLSLGGSPVGPTGCCGKSTDTLRFFFFCVVRQALVFI